MGQLDHRDALRPEEQHQGDEPEPDGDATVSGDAGDYVEIEDGDYEQQHQVPAAEDALEVGLFGGGHVCSLGLPDLKLSGGNLLAGASREQIPRFARNDNTYDVTCTCDSDLGTVFKKTRLDGASPVPHVLTSLLLRTAPVVLRSELGLCRRMRTGAFLCPLLCVAPR